MKILNYGSINIDVVFSVPRIVRPGETISSVRVRQFAGGKGANQSVALAKAGAAVWQAGKIGEEDGWLLRKLAAHGVNTDLIRQYSGPSGQAVIQVTPEAENSIILSGGGNLAISKHEVDLALSHFAKGDVLVVQNEINETPYIIQTERTKG